MRYPCAAQQTISYASLSGRVLDSSGGAVESAEVTANQIETKFGNVTRTDAEGRFRFPYLKVGAYEITFQKQGFAVVTKELTLGVGGAYEVPVTLGVAGSTVSVQVSSNADILEA